jgi:hypothetical protein
MSVLAWLKQALAPTAASSSEPFLLNVSLSHVAGFDWGAGGPCLYASLVGGFVAGRRSSALLCVLSRVDQGTQWREWQAGLSEADARDLVRLMAAAGFPQRAPRVVGVVDTTEGWNELTFRAKVTNQQWGFTISMCHSGFDGPDAESVRHIFSRLFALASFAGHDTRVFGSPRLTGV